MRYIVVLLSVFLSLTPIAHAATVGLDSGKVDKAFDFQKDPVWCWAATIEMALNYYGFNITQKKIVERTFGAAVSSTGNWMQMTNNLNYLGTTADGKKVLVSATVYMGAPSNEAIVNHLRQQKPIILAFNNPNTFSGHAILVTGVEFHYVGDRVFIDKMIIRDPYPYSQDHVDRRGKVVVPYFITPTNIWLVDATVEP
ncbi:MAG: C39 family peptidase [Betaproteobacteria bacterium]|nr:C39 family peptidase [Betaproteobacteria bacterium]